MGTILQCQSEDDVQRLLRESSERPVMLFKHSTRCPISAAAKRHFDQFAARTEDVTCWVVLVIEHRPLSQQLAREVGVSHQSPQVILLVNGQSVWNTSHGLITESALLQAVTIIQPVA